MRISGGGAGFFPPMSCEAKKVPRQRLKRGRVFLSSFPPFSFLPGAKNGVDWKEKKNRGEIVPCNSFSSTPVSRALLPLSLFLPRHHFLCQMIFLLFLGCDCERGRQRATYSRSWGRKEVGGRLGKGRRGGKKLGDITP